MSIKILTLSRWESEHLHVACSLCPVCIGRTVVFWCSVWVAAAACHGAAGGKPGKSQISPPTRDPLSGVDQNPCPLHSIIYLCYC